MYEHLYMCYKKHQGKSFENHWLCKFSDVKSAHNMKYNQSAACRLIWERNRFCLWCEACVGRKSSFG